MGKNQDSGSPEVAEITELSQESGSQGHEILEQARKEFQMHTGIKQKIYLALGFLFLFLAGVGVALPLIPTTPFLLLSTALFLKSSQRMYNWVMQNKVFGPYMLNYNKRQMRKADKITTISVLWIGILLSAYFVPVFIAKIVLLGIAVGVTWHILSLKTV